MLEWRRIHSLKRKAHDKVNASLGNSLRWPIYIINQVDKIKLCYSNLKKLSIGGGLRQGLAYNYEQHYLEYCTLKKHIPQTLTFYIKSSWAPTSNFFVPKGPLKSLKFACHPETLLYRSIKKDLQGFFLCMMPSKMLSTQEDSGAKYKPSAVNHA